MTPQSPFEEDDQDPGDVASLHTGTGEAIEPGAEGLREALDNLEELLGTRENSPTTTTTTAPSIETAQTPRQHGEPETKARFLDAQYSIPLLEDVVVPGAGAQDSHWAAETDDFRVMPDPMATHLAARLASEIEVIVITRAEAAIRSAIADIQQEVRRHVEIVLPQILDELANKDSDPS